MTEHDGAGLGSATDFANQLAAFDAESFAGGTQKKQWRESVADLPQNVELIGLLDEEKSEVVSFDHGRAVFHRPLHMGFIEWSDGDLWPMPPTEVTCWLSRRFLDDSTLFAALPFRVCVEKMCIFTRAPRRSSKGDAHIVPLDASHKLPPFFAREAKWCLRSKRPAYVALEGDEVASFAYAPWASGKHFDISVVTFAEHRRRGWGKKVVQALLDAPPFQEKNAVWGALESNQVSFRLATSLGFQKHGSMYIVQATS